MKDKFGADFMIEFIALRAKMYAYSKLDIARLNYELQRQKVCHKVREKSAR